MWCGTTTRNQLLLPLELKSVGNLLPLCGDASVIVPSYIPPESISHIFMYPVLVINGNITNVTDNLPYAMSLLESLRAILERFIASESDWGYVSKALAKDSDEADKRTIQATEKLEEGSRVLKLELWRGEAGKETGHVVNCSSYFDRMWNNGEKKRRYFICLQKHTKG